MSARFRASYERMRMRGAAFRIGAAALARRALPNEAQHLFALTLLVGLICGFVAVAFHLAIKLVERLLIDRALHAQGPSFVVWTILTPTLGGLFAGAILTWLVPGARGSGIPQVKVAFAVEGGRVRFRDAFGKFVVGALQIGSGASLGREGPTVQICAGAASLLARATALPPRHMRRLVPVGVAAGIAAAFNAPIAAVTFTIEEIVGTLDQAVLSGVVVAAALAAVIERSILGVHPVIEVSEPYALDHASSIGLYAVLGLAAAFVSIAFTDGLLLTRLWFRRLRAVPAWTHPALGGMATGVLAVVLMRGLGTGGVTGGGYETLGLALAGHLGVRMLVALCVVKLVATVLSYSSGGAGGIFAPSLFVGAMLGGIVGYLDVFLLHHESRQLGAFALVGMGAVFAGVIRAPITAVLIIFEMTGGYGLVLPLMLASTTAYAIARRLRPTPIYEALLEQDGIELPKATRAPESVEQLKVSDVMTHDVVTAKVDQSVREALAHVGEASFACMPVVDEDGTLRQRVPIAELRQAEADAKVASIARPTYAIRSDDSLLRAIVRMNDAGVRQLFVVDPETGKRLVGVIAMADIVRAHARNGEAVEGLPLRSAPPGPRPDFRIDSLLTRVEVVPGSTKIADLATRLQTEPQLAFVVRDDAQVRGILLPEHVHEFTRDPELVRMLIAADLARAATALARTESLETYVQALQARSSEAAIVLEDAHKEPIGLLTRRRLAEAILDWYARGPALRGRAARA